MWDAAAAPLLGILRELRPDAVLVLGRAVEQHPPADFPEEIPKTTIYHPSSRVDPRTGERYFNHATANPAFAGLITLAREKTLKR